MGLIRLVVATVALGGLALYLGRIVIVGLASGKVPHTDSKHVCHRASNPVGFWALIALFAAIVGASLFVWAKVAHEILQGWTGGA